MDQYLALGRKILEEGIVRPDRTGTGTRSLFGQQMRFDLSKGFPLVTTKFVPIRLIIEELIWFLSGDTNNNTLVNKNVHIWDEWALPNGDLGPVYGAMWRSWPGKIMAKSEDAYELTDGQVVAREYTGGGPEIVHYQETIDQIKELIQGLKTKPFSRRHIVSGWNPAFLPDESASHAENVTAGRQALPPCHTLFQFYVREMSTQQRAKWLKKNKPEEYHRLNDQMSAEIRAGKFRATTDEESDNLLIARNIELFHAATPRFLLDCQLYQRSADVAVGVPFNIASYAALTMMVAQCVDMVPGEFIHTFGDSHLYGNHVDKFRDVQLPREPYELPTLKINPAKKDIFSFEMSDFELVNYKHHPKIVYDVAV